jgi:hypothetical protein
VIRACSQVFTAVSLVIVMMTLFFLGPVRAHVTVRSRACVLAIVIALRSRLTPLPLPRQVFAYMPKVTGSAIIVTAAIGLFEFHDVLFLVRGRVVMTCITHAACIPHTPQWRLRSYSSIALFLFTFVMTVMIGIELVCIVLTHITHCIVYLTHTHAGHSLLSRALTVSRAQASVRAAHSIPGPGV